MDDHLLNEGDIGLVVRPAGCPGMGIPAVNPGPALDIVPLAIVEADTIDVGVDPADPT